MNKFKNQMKIIQNKIFIFIGHTISFTHKRHHMPYESEVISLMERYKKQYQSIFYKLQINFEIKPTKKYEIIIHLYRK